MSEKPLISTDNINLKNADTLILDNVSLNVFSKEIVTIIGPNGAGKSTLLSIILKLVKPSSGFVFHNKNLVCGFVPQSINRDETLPMTVSEFLKLSKRLHSQRKMNDLLNSLNILHLSGKLLYQLSGGETRKVLLARALLNRPNLLVLDEPTAGVDVKGQAAFYESLNDLRREYHFSILMVSHDLHFVMAKTDRVICLNKKICCEGAPKSIESHPVFLSQFAQSLKDEAVAIYNHQHL